MNDTAVHLDPNVVVYNSGRKPRVVHTFVPQGGSVSQAAILAALGASDAPGLDLSGRGTGSTGYLDFLVAGDLKSPIMQGQDDAGRPFVAIRYQRRPAGGGGSWGSPRVQTLFQRYRGGGPWVSGGSGGPVDSRPMELVDLANLKRLATGEFTSRDDEYRLV